MSQGIAFVFPGQGSQAVGMGADVYAASPSARAVFAAADDALGVPLSSLCFEGPDETLRETINAQPAIVAVSIALLAALREALGADAPTLDRAPIFAAGPQPEIVAGHSVGEYSALLASGAADFASAIRLVRERGRLMHHEGTVCAGGMAAVLGMDDAALVSLCAEATDRVQATLSAATQGAHTHPGMGRVIVANYNSPGQTVLSGERHALEIAMDLARERGAKRVVPLAVSGAFHSPVMAPAAEGLRQAVADTPLHDTAIPLISNITAQPIQTASDLRDELARQIASPVQWTRSVDTMVECGVHTFVEIGPGQVLAGLIKRIARSATVVSVSSAGDLSSASERLRPLLGV